MNSNEKKVKKEYLSKFLDLNNGHYKDGEIDTLTDLVDNRESMNGKTRSIKHCFDDWCSDGKYRRNEETKYTFHGDSDKISVNKKYSYHDDDGQTGGYEESINTGRELLNLLHYFKK
jgi:hypothetical protein